MDLDDDDDLTLDIAWTIALPTLSYCLLLPDDELPPLEDDDDLLELDLPLEDDDDDDDEAFLRLSRAGCPPACSVFLSCVSTIR